MNISVQGNKWENWFSSDWSSLLWCCLENELNGKCFPAQIINYVIKISCKSYNTFFRYYETREIIVSSVRFLFCGLNLNGLQLLASSIFLEVYVTRLVIGTSRAVGSAKKFVRITSGFGGGEFTKRLRKVCTYQKLKFSFLLLEYCKIRECYAVANAITIRNMYSLFLYMKCNSRKINRPTKNMTKIVTLLHF